MCGRDQANSDKQALTDHYLSRLIPFAEYFIYTQTGFLSAHLVS